MPFSAGIIIMIDFFNMYILKQIEKYACVPKQKSLKRITAIKSAIKLNRMQ